MAPVPGEDIRLPPSLRLLRALVMALLLSMIGGVIAMVWLLVTRLPVARQSAAPVQTTPNPPPSLPAAIALPAGEVAAAVTYARDMLLVVTETGRILIFAADGALRQEVTLAP